MKYLINILRIIVGVVFIISGIVKTIDPIGFSYKLEEYFSESVLNLPFLIPYALVFSTVFVVFEVILGIFLLLGIFKKFTLINLLFLIVIFTFLTFYSAYYDKVKDCGCFGDFLKLKPWESFTKDVVLLIMILIIGFGCKYIQPIFNTKLRNSIALIGIFITCWIAYQGIFHLPLVDFRAYAEGKNLIEGRKSVEELGLKPPKIATFYTLNHLKTKEQKEMNDSVYIESGIWEDSLWVIDETKTYSKVVKEGYEPPIPPDFSIECNGENVTDKVLNENKIVIISLIKLKSLSVEQIAKVHKLVHDLKLKNIKSIIVSNDTNLHGLQICNLDEKVIKTINRSQVGIMILKKGIVIKKYHYNDFPEISEIINL